MVSNPHIPQIYMQSYMRDQLGADYQTWKDAQNALSSNDQKHRKLRVEHYMRTMAFKINFREWQKRVLNSKFNDLIKGDTKNVLIQQALTAIGDKLKKVEGWLEKNG